MDKPKPYLFETINTVIEKIKDYNPGIFAIPEYISSNLKHKLFEWQTRALENFLYYNDPKSKLFKSPTHLMFNMATGTGKTLLMAAVILYYYKQGYRHFLFFVNQNNIVDKTENNFIDSAHSKYLFTDNIVIDEKIVNIKKVDTFSEAPKNIEIKFTTIQKLYNDVHIEKENQTTLDDLQKLNIVMLGDEAHHLNADTKGKNGQLEIDYKTELSKKSSSTEIERKGWEHTVIELILNKQNSKHSNSNVLIEFTATIPDNINVQKKYIDKIVYQFTLKSFLQAGYTKHINLLSSSSEAKERILLALLFNWYRYKIGIKHGLRNFKPVMLFRSKTIEESKADYALFNKTIEELKPEDYNFIRGIDVLINNKETLFEMGQSRFEQIISYISTNGISISEIVDFLQYNFAEKNCIITNSKTNKTKSEVTDEEIDKLLNNLESPSNHIRAIFTVDRLTEGWDVLNLYDIVRMYQTNPSGGSTSKTPDSTVKEKQLIGRGVRYYPFEYKDIDRRKRKFDKDLHNEMRILEELYYYTYDEASRYISHLKEELRKDGYIDDGMKTVTVDLKQTFKDSEFFGDMDILYNEQIDNPNRRKKELAEAFSDFEYTYRVPEFTLTEEELDISDYHKDRVRLVSKEENHSSIFKTISEIERHIFRKAINIKSKTDNSIFKFANLKQELEISSIDDLFTDKFLGSLRISIINRNMNYDNIPNKAKLRMCLGILDEVYVRLNTMMNPKIGTDFKFEKFSKFFARPKTKSISKTYTMTDTMKTIVNENEWYAVDNFIGNSEEEELVKFVNGTIANLKEKYSEVYLIRNEEVFKIYDFEQGRGFQPDFLLFLKENQDEEQIYYQIFIEVKGGQFLGTDNQFGNGKEGWKEDFLKQITERYGDKKIANHRIIKKENEYFKLIGLPFYNQSQITPFKNEYNKLIGEQE